MNVNELALSVIKFCLFKESFVKYIHNKIIAARLWYIKIIFCIYKTIYDPHKQAFILKSVCVQSNDCRYDIKTSLEFSSIIVDLESILSLIQSYPND